MIIIDIETKYIKCEPCSIITAYSEERGTPHFGMSKEARKCFGMSKKDLKKWKKDMRKNWKKLTKN